MFSELSVFGCGMSGVYSNSDLASFVAAGNAGVLFPVAMEFCVLSGIGVSSANKAE